MSEELQDEVRAAMEEVSQKEDEAPTTETPTEVEAAAKLEPAKPEATPEVAAEPATPVEPIVSKDQAPRGWSPASREKWATLPEDIRQEIIRREDASAVGVRQLQEKYQPMEQFVNSIGGLINEANHYGVDAGGYITQVMGAERGLRTADVPGKFQILLSLADQYGVPLRDIINESVGQRVLPSAQAQPQMQMQIPPQIMSELYEMRQWREQQTTGNVNSQIQQFAADKEFFNDVHLTMAGLLDSGVANDLQEAYDSACWANPEIRAIMTQRQALTGSQKAAAGASIKPGVGVTVTGTYNEDDELEDTVRRAFAQSTSGRV